jgi:hypothetical protein
MNKKEYCMTHESVAYYSGLNGLEIKGIEYGIDDYIYCVSGAWGGGKGYHRCKVQYTRNGCLGHFSRCSGTGCRWTNVSEWGCSRGITCNSVFPAASSGGAAENKQIIFKPSEHCPGGFSFCPRPDQARRCPFALPTWRGFSLAMPCKALSGFLSGFYSGNIN